MRILFGSRRGNSMIEFALAAPLTFAIMAGTFQFGYAFYVYNQLQLSVRSAVRYGSRMDYKGTSTACIASSVDTVKNMVVYGTPTAGTTPVVRGLSKTNVTVNFNGDVKAVPTTVTVSITGFAVNALVTTFTFNQKPMASIPYVGRYSPVECE